MTTQITQPFRVVYDEEKNKYYRVNKITGEIQPSYKTGKLPAKFDPQITGIDYVARKKSIDSDNFGNTFRSGKKSNLTNYSKKVHTETSQKSFDKTKQIFSITQSAYSHDFNSTNFVSSHNKVKLPKGHTTDMKRTFQLKNHSSFIKDDRKDTSILLPKLKNPNSFYLLQQQNAEKKMPNSSIFQSLENSKKTIKPKVLDSQNSAMLKSEFSLSLNKKLNASLYSQISQNESQSNKLQNKLRKFCEIQQLKLHQNNFQPLQNNQKSQRFHKFTEQALLTSLLDDSRTSLEPTQRKNSLFSKVERQERNTVTRNDIAKSVDNLEKENASLFLLAKKCQKHSQFQRSPHSNRKSPEALSQLINYQTLESQHKLKTLLQKQKQTFLSFYPKYNFKQNVRLLQEQRDRKINLKNLEKSFLENGERKFGKIYQTQTQKAKETI